MNDQDIAAMRADIARLKVEVATRPSWWAMIVSIVVGLLGTAVTVAITVTTLHALGLLR
ncbi:MAG: hypothetical protein ACJ8AI_10135 [Rhodopila sp.]